MVLIPGSLGWFYSGGASKANQDGDQGGVISSVRVPDQDLQTTPLTKNTLWNDVTTTVRIAGGDFYRCLYLKNVGGQTASNIKLYVDANTPAPDDVAIGYSGNAVNTPEQFLTSNLQNLYTLATSGSSVSLLSDIRKGQGIWLNDANHPMASVPIVQWDVYLKAVNVPTGTLNARIYHRSDDIINGTASGLLGSLDVTTIPTDQFKKFSFINMSNTYKMVLDDVLILKYLNGTAADQIQIARVGNDPKAGVQIAGNDGQNWINVSSWDMAGDVWGGGAGGDRIAPTGITFINPTSIDNAISLPNLAPGDYVGVWFKRHIPANCATMTGDSFEVTVSFTSPTP